MKITQQQENLILLARAGNSTLYRFYFSSPPPPSDKLLDLCPLSYQSSGLKGQQQFPRVKLFSNDDLMTRKAFFKSEHQRLFNKYLQLTVQKGKHLCSFKTSSSSSSSASSSSPSPSPSPSDSLKRGEGFWRSHSFQGEQRGYHSSATEECKWGKYKKKLTAN